MNKAIVLSEAQYRALKDVTPWGRVPRLRNYKTYQALLNRGLIVKPVVDPDYGMQVTVAGFDALLAAMKARHSPNASVATIESVKRNCNTEVDTQ